MVDTSIRQAWLRPLWLAAVAVGPAVLGAQAPVPPPDSSQVTVTARYPTDRFIGGRAAVSLEFDRVIPVSAGRVVVMVGAHDITGLFERGAMGLTRKHSAVLLPAGEHELTVYLARGDEYRELGRFPIKVLNAAGLSTAQVTPGFSLNNKGQLAEGHSGDAAEPDRATYQDLGGSVSLRGVHGRGALSIETQANFVGTTRRQEALRFGQKQDDAPLFDLSDFSVKLGAGPISVGLGQLNTGRNRHLVSGYSSRGASMHLGNRAVSINAASLAGSSIVGWDNPLGVGDNQHRVSTADVGFEIVPDKPGTLKLDLSLLDAARLPATGFTQGAVIDAEESDGAGIQVAAALPSQRLRAAAGYTWSRFANPEDRDDVSAGLPVRHRTRSTNGARWVEANAVLLQNARIAGAMTSLNAGYRHERVDPLYRSVAAFAQADQQQNFFELSGALGVLTLQATHSRNGDNLDDVPSVLTTLGRNSGTQFSLPLGQLIRVAPALWPSLSFGFNRQHQFGDGIPVNGEFSASHVPDQLNRGRDLSAQWQGSRWRLGYRYNRNAQDNRQPGRERADFVSSSHATSFGLTPHTAVSVNVDASFDRQLSKEQSVEVESQRVGVMLDWRMTPTTGLSMNLSGTWRDDSPITSKDRSTEARLELSRTFTLWSWGQRAARGQGFLRFAHQSADAWRFDALGIRTSAIPRGSWTLTSGFNLGVM